MGQILSRKPEIIKDDKLRKILEDLSDKVPPIDKRFILSALKRDNIDTSKIKTIGKLLGSASLKQVYKVTLTDDSEFVIKFNRPMSYYEIPENMEILRKLFNEQEIKEKLPISDQLVSAIDESVSRELEIKNEIVQQVKISTFIKKHTNKMNKWSIDVPVVRDDLKGDHVYMDQWAKGESFKTDLIKVLPPEDTKTISKLIYTSLLEQIFTNGLYHADLHGGNILVDKEKKKVNLIDFGNCNTLSNENRNKFIKLILNLKSNNASKTISVLASLLGKQEDRQKFNEEKATIIEEVTKILSDKSPANEKISEKIRLIKNYLDSKKIAFNSEMELLLKIFDTTKYISDNLNSTEIENIFKKAIMPSLLKNPLLLFEAALSGL
ncbi:MAG: hypothetical protein HQK49_00065 [Oligoflexia bacterium]|nr:hypothetical protein [Oligoflexia bacterium]